MGRGGRRFLDGWHDRTVDLPGGDRLFYVAMDSPPPTRLECTRTALRGAICREEAHRLLVELGHPDAALRLPETGALGPGAVR